MWICDIDIVDLNITQKLKRNWLIYNKYVTFNYYIQTYKWVFSQKNNDGLSDTDPVLDYAYPVPTRVQRGLGCTWPEPESQPETDKIKNSSIRIPSQAWHISNRNWPEPKIFKSEPQVSKN